MQILGICGSLQSHSNNLALLRVAAATVPAGVELIVFDGVRALPHFNPALEAVEVPESVTEWRNAVATSDALFITCPEYGFSLPGALKNAIDWVIGSGELERKVVAITAAVPTRERGRRGLNALRDTLSAVRASIVGGEPIPLGADFEKEVRELVQLLVAAARDARHPGA
jgi:NAD(P)H-dependent FMN reductase